MASWGEFVDGLVVKMLAQKPGWQMNPQELAADNANRLDAATGMVGGINSVGKVLTGSEKKLFQTMKEGDWAELKELVPSVRLMEGKLHIDPKDVNGLTTWVDDVTRLREGERLPPSFYSGDFYKAFWPK